MRSDRGVRTGATPARPSRTAVRNIGLQLSQTAAANTIFESRNTYYIVLIHHSVVLEILNPRAYRTSAVRCHRGTARLSRVIEL